jgi:galactokinase
LVLDRADFFGALREKATSLHHQRFNAAPQWLAAAPGRANLIGEHVDYNDGIVLPFAIDRYTVLAASSASGKHTTIHSFTFDESASIDHTTVIAPGQPTWMNYVKGVWHAFGEMGCHLPPLDVSIYSTVPTGGGLSSSAALEVATATLLEAVTGNQLSKIEKVQLCQKAEHEFAGVPCGMMDQFTSVHGTSNHLLMLDCRDLTFNQTRFTSTQVAIVLFDSGVKHQLGTSEYPLRRQECHMACQLLNVISLRNCSLEELVSKQALLPPVVFRRARHVITEIERTAECAKAIDARDWVAAGQYMYQSHHSLRTDYEVSCIEVDSLVEIAKLIGVDGGIYGCRMTGGGFGGYAIALVDCIKLKEVVDRLKSEYQNKTGIDGNVFVTKPSDGAFMFNTAR